MKTPRCALIAAVIGLAVSAESLAHNDRNRDRHHPRPTAETSFVQRAAIELDALGRYESGIFDGSAAEIAGYDPRGRHVFVTNANANTLDVLSLRDVRRPRLVRTIDLSPYGAGVNSVAVRGRLVAVALEAEPKQDPGAVVLLDTQGRYLASVTVGALPDMLTFTPDGTRIVVANEGEPDDDYAVDPEGSVSIIHVPRDPRTLTQADVTEVSFAAFNDMDLPGVRVFGPNASVAQDLEPEYVAVSADSSTAWVTLQEANAVAIIDLDSAQVTEIVALGTKDHSVIQNALDASDRDGGIHIRPWPVVGMYLPDAIAAYTVGDATYLVTANEGDSRDYDGYSEEARVKDHGDDFLLDPDAYPDIDALAANDAIGRLKITTATGDTDGDGDIDVLHAFGGRSFSILDASGRIVYDSGSDFERRLARFLPDTFNSTNDKNGSFDSRSDDKGPEPEGVTTGVIDGRTYAFIGLERVGGIMVYDVTDPQAPEFVQYITTRDFAGDADAGTAGDLGPEGTLFVAAEDSPIRTPLLIVTNEVSGSTTVFAIRSARISDRDAHHDRDRD